MLFKISQNEILELTIVDIIISIMQGGASRNIILENFFILNFFYALSFLFVQTFIVNFLFYCT